MPVRSAGGWPGTRPPGPTASRCKPRPWPGGTTARYFPSGDTAAMASVPMYRGCAMQRDSDGAGTKPLSQLGPLKTPVRLMTGTTEPTDSCWARAWEPHRDQTGRGRCSRSSPPRTSRGCSTGRRPAFWNRLRSRSPGQGGVSRGPRLAVDLEHDRLDARRARGRTGERPDQLRGRPGRESSRRCGRSPRRRDSPWRWPRQPRGGQDLGLAGERRTGPPVQPGRLRRLGERVHQADDELLTPTRPAARAPSPGPGPAVTGEEVEEVQVLRLVVQRELVLVSIR